MNKNFLHCSLLTVHCLLPTVYSLAAPESYAGVLVLRVETEFVIGTLAFVVRVPGSACNKEFTRMLLAYRGCPFPKVSVHVVHTKPASALVLTAAAFSCFRICIALVLLVAVAVRVTCVVLTTACGLPFF